MGFKGLISNNKTKAEGASSLPSVALSKEEAEVLLSAIKQSTFRGEYAKDVVSLIIKFEEHIAKFS